MSVIRKNSGHSGVEGEIGYFGLTDWWLSEFTDAERERIETKFRPLGTEDGERPLTQGKVTYTSQTAAGLLQGLATWFEGQADRHIAIRLLKKAEELAKSSGSRLSSGGKGRPLAKPSSRNVVDLHFIYQGLIETYYKNRNEDPSALQSAIDACEAQIAIAPSVARAFQREFPDTPLPGHIGFLRLVEIRARQKNFPEVMRLCDEALQQCWAGSWEAEKADLKVEEIMTHAETLIAEGDVNSATARLEEIFRMDETRRGAVYKRLGEYFLQLGRESEAFDFFKKAVAADPLIRGVQMKLKRLSRKLGAELEFDTTATIRALEEKERNASEWWAKRELADEYTRLGLFDKAWRFFNEAIVLRAKNGGPCDSIYPRMARMLEKEGKYREAIFHYLLARNEILRLSHSLPITKSIAQGIDRCLKKLGLQGWDHKRLFQEVGAYREPSLLGDSLKPILP
jgi:hypothetical protein